MLDAVVASGVDVDRVIAAWPWTRETLEDPSVRLPWDDFCDLFELLEEGCGGREGLIAAARRWTEVSSFGPLARLYQLAAEPFAILWLVQRWIGPMLFSPLSATLERLSDRDARMTVQIEAGYRGCPLFFATTAVTLGQATRVLGLPDAEVVSTIEPHRAVYVFRLPKSRTLLGRLRDALPRSGPNEVLVEELRSHADQLHERMVELAEAREVAEKALRHKDAFLARVSHDLRTPLNAIIGMASMLAHDELSEHQRANVAVIRMASDELLMMVDDLLERPRAEPSSPPGPAPVDLAQRRRAVASKPEAPPQPTLQVLVAEDNPINLRVTRRLLERMGHEVACVVDGVEAVEAAQGGAFDIILMDVSMPRLDGVEATKRIRALGGPHARVPIVAVTAHATDDVRNRCLAAGMNDYLTKPVRMAVLAQAVVRNACGVRDSA